MSTISRGGFEHLPSVAEVRRRLPIRVPLGGGESFASYMDRLAAELDVPLIALLAFAGLAPTAHWRSMPSGYGTSLSSSQVADLGLATGLEQGAFAASLLTTFDQVALDFTRAVPGQSGYAARIGWAHVAGSWYCPECLGEEPVWMVAWKLPWSFVCPRHDRLLLNACLECGGISWRGPRSEARPSFASRVPRPGYCSAVAARVDSRGRAARPCGASLASFRGVQVADDRVLRAQQFVTSVLEGAPARVFGRSVAPLEFFDDLRSLVATFLFGATVRDLGRVDDLIADRFERHVDSRSRRLELPGAGRWAGRFYAAVPDDPMMLVAVVPSALDVLQQPSASSAAQQLTWLGSNLADERRRDALPLPSAFRLSSRLRPVVGAALAGPRRGAPIAGLVIQPARVPQLLWDEVYDREFGSLIPNVRRDKARMFCSVALVKCALGVSWEEAAAALDLPSAATARSAHGVLAVIEATGHGAVFRSRLGVVAQDSSIVDRRVDYRRRRAAVGRIAPTELPARFGSLPRRRALLAWLWSEYAGGDPRRAPAWGGCWRAAERAAFRRVTAGETADLRAELVTLVCDLDAAVNFHHTPSGSSAVPGSTAVVGVRSVLPIRVGSS